MERHMAGDPGGEGAARSQLHKREKRGSERRGRTRRSGEEYGGGKLNYGEGGYSGAHESAFAEEQYLNRPDFVLCKLLFQAESIFIPSVYR